MHGGNRPQQIIYIVQRRQIGGDPVCFPGVTKGERAPGRTLLNLLCEIVNCVGTAHRRMGAVNRITVLIRELLSLIRAVGHEAAADIPLQRIDADHIICIQHRHRLRLQVGKKPFLRRQVALHGLVVIQMVMGQVGENRTVEVHRIHPAPVQPLGTDFHGTGFHAVIHHFLQIGVSLDLVRRGQIRHPGVIAVTDGDGSHVTTGPVMGIHIADHAGQRRLAVSAGGSKHGHMPARASEIQIADPVDLCVHILHMDIYRTRQLLHRFCADDCRCSGVVGLPGEPVAVRLITFDTKKQIPRLHGAGIQGQPGDIHIHPAVQLRPVRKQFRKKHNSPPSSFIDPFVCHFTSFPARCKETCTGPEESLQ